VGCPDGIQPKNLRYTTTLVVVGRMKKVEMLRRLYMEVLNGRSEFRWSDFFALLAPIASHTYIELMLYELIGRGVMIKQDRKYIVNVEKLEELLKQYNAI
jgi:hypothetical protein